MLISTKGRYALRIMADLAENKENGLIPMKTIAERQEISLKYLERILPSLVKKGLIEGIHGKGGGYRLTREPKDYQVGEILKLAEGDFAPIACLKEDAKECSRKDFCQTLPLWSKLDSIINDFLFSVSLQDLLDKNF